MLTQIPERARQVLYTVYAALVFIAGGISVGYNSAGNGQPTWLDVGMDVLAYAGAALGVTAAANVGNSGPAPLAVDGRHEAPEAGYNSLNVIMWAVVVIAAVLLVVYVLIPLLDNDPGRADMVRLLL